MTRADGLVCLITDRRRLADAMGRPVEEGPELVVELVEAAGRAGADLVQIRERDLDGRVLAALVRAARAALAGAPTRLVVNDRLDVAAAAGADGVHLREDSVPSEAARRLAPRPFLVGRSVHDAAGARAAGPVDYLLASPVFPTSSKPAPTPWLGVHGLRAIVAAGWPLPVLALGGVGPKRVAEFRGAGVAGVAAIGAFLPPAPGADLATHVEKVVAELRIPV
ncbi:MAG: thiamine phosphate synthase [Acidobacteriota bacterium]